MTDYTIPRANAPIAGTEPPSTQWYNFIRYLDSRSSSATGDVQAEITVIAEKLGSPDGTVDNIPPLGNVTSVQGKQSIASSGIGVVQLRLVNDASTPDAVSFYGTDSSGVKGWNLLYDAFADTANIFKINTDGIVSFDLTDLADSGTGALLATTFDAKGRKTGTKAATITGTAGRIAVDNGDAVAGLPTIDLATLSDGGGGTLLRIVRDAWGRLSGTSAATTSDLTEGSNLYFTTARVLATLLAGLSTATSAAITAADSVLSAFGKLQAQITALTSSLTGYVPTTRTISTTAPLTGGGDLSANRTLALANTAVTPASYGDATHVATFTVDAQGRLTAAGSVAITAGAVSSVFGRTGAVVAAANDYIFAQIGSTPTTLAGYGITDAEPTIAAGTTAQYWRGDKTWQTLNKAAVGLSNVDNTSDANKPVSTAQQTALDLKLATATPAGYIDGLKMVWNSATSISVTSGACYIQGSSAVIAFPSLLTLSSLSLSASTWYHLYGYLSSGTPTIELVTTAPAAPYSGTARSKTGDTSRRYIGSVKTDVSGAIYNFLHSPSSGVVLYQSNISPAPFQVANGSAAAATSASCSAVIPITGISAAMAYSNNDSAVTVLLGNSISPPSNAPSFLSQVGRSVTSEGALPLDASQAFQYMFLSAPTANFVARVKGYNYER